MYGRSSAFLVAFALAKKKEAFSPSEGWHHCFPRFVDQALNGDPLTVFGDGQQTRCVIDPKRLPRRTGDIRHSYADISLAKALLDWDPRADWLEAVRATVDWFKTRGS